MSRRVALLVLAVVAGLAVWTVLVPGPAVDGRGVLAVAIAVGLHLSLLARRGRGQRRRTPTSSGSAPSAAPSAAVPRQRDSVTLRIDVDLTDFHAALNGRPMFGMTPVEWEDERRAAYQRARGLGIAVLILLATLLGVLVVGVASAAAATPTPVAEPADYTAVNLAIASVALVLVAYIGLTEWAKRREGRDR